MEVDRPVVLHLVDFLSLRVVGPDVCIEVRERRNTNLATLLVSDLPGNGVQGGDNPELSIRTIAPASQGLLPSGGLIGPSQGRLPVVSELVLVQKHKSFRFVPCSKKTDFY